MKCLTKFRTTFFLATVTRCKSYVDKNNPFQALSLLANAATSVAAAANMNEGFVEDPEEDDGGENELKVVAAKLEGSAVSDSGSTESKTESEGLLTIDETAQALEQEGDRKTTIFGGT